MVFSAIEGTLQVQGTVSGTDATPISLDPSSHAVKVYIENQAAPIISNPIIVLGDLVALPLVGTDGITITSGTNTQTVAGFRSELLTVSGNLQSQVSAVESSDVDSINGLQGALSLVGDSFINVSSSVSTLTVAAKSLVGGNHITISSGTNSVLISADDSPVPNAIVAGTANLSVTSGTNTTTVSLTGDLTLTTISGTPIVRDQNEITIPVRGMIAISGTQCTFFNGSMWVILG